MMYETGSESNKEGIVCGMLMGDGSRHNNSLYIGHSEKQLEYALFKKELLERLTGKSVNVRYVVSYSKKQDKNYKTVRIYPKQTNLIRNLVALLYSNGHKQITRFLLDRLTPEGIAIWYMDDGSMSVKKGYAEAVGVTLNTYVPQEINRVIIQYFKEKWNVDWILNRSKNSWRLHMGTKAARRFFPIIEPFIHPSMYYKVAPLYSINSVNELHDLSST